MMNISAQLHIDCANLRMLLGYVKLSINLILTFSGSWQRRWHPVRCWAKCRYKNLSQFYLHLVVGEN